MLDTLNKIFCVVNRGLRLCGRYIVGSLEKYFVQCAGDTFTKYFEKESHQSPMGWGFGAWLLHLTTWTNKQSSSVCVLIYEYTLALVVRTATACVCSRLNSSGFSPLSPLPLSHDIRLINHV